MKITKEMTAEMRAGALAAMESAMIPGASTELLINPLVLLALLDERAAMLAAVKDIATALRARATMRAFPNHPEASVYLAAVRDFENHPAFCGIEKE